MKHTSLRGLMVVLDGPEGAGKSTNLKFLSQYMISKGIEHTLTREPGGTNFGLHIRSILSDPESIIDPVTETLMIFADRVQHFSSVIEPALSKGKWVLCDRFIDATYAYQGGGQGVDHNVIASLEFLTLKGFHPDAVIILDLPVEISLARAKKRGALDRYEQQSADFHQNVREVYLKRAQENPKTHIVIDAHRDLSSIQNDLMQIIDRLNHTQSTNYE